MQHGQDNRAARVVQPKCSPTLRFFSSNSKVAGVADKKANELVPNTNIAKCALKYFTLQFYIQFGMVRQLRKYLLYTKYEKKKQYNIKK